MNAVLQSAARTWLVSAFRRFAPATTARDDTVMGAGRLQSRTLSAIFAILAVIYTLWPLDFIPDVVPFLGWLDDGLALLLAFQAARQAFCRSGN